MTTRIVRRRKRNRKKKIRIVLTFLFIIAIFVGVGFYYASQVYTASYQDLERGEKSDLREEAVDIGKDPISILLLGVEDYSTNGEAGRADTQIVMTLDPETKEMTMTSIPRDTRVELSEEKVGQYAGSHKINATYSLGELSGYGAEKLAVETVEDYLGIPIDTYATVNFEGFIEIVDLLGGVTIDVEEGFWERSSIDYYKIIEFEEGPTKMTGEEALAFVRMRKREDVALSYPRDERQRQFIKASIDQAISAGTIFKVGQISDVVGQNISTNLSPREIYAIQKAFSSDKADTKTINIEGTNERLEDGLFYFVPDEESLENVKDKLQDKLNYNGSDESAMKSSNSESSSS